MGDILSKLKMVSEKVGVTETAHTIEEQIDLITESLDKVPASTNITEALDDLSEVAQNINNDEIYIDKTITENGTYLPAEDEATAYSKIIANVPNSYTVQDEGKVVDNGELVSQTVMPSSITQNGTVNTTLYNSVTVDVPPPSNEFYPSVKTQSLTTQNDTGDTWLAKTWNGLMDFTGDYIWTDGDNIYYSNDNDQYVLDKTTSTWITKTWNGLTSFFGDTIWTDGDNIYYQPHSTTSGEPKQYVLDKATSTWSAKTWSGITTAGYNTIWTDGDNIYYSSGSSQYVLDKTTSTWSAKTWSGLTNFAASGVWTDGDNIYYSVRTGADSFDQYVLDKTTSTWSAKTWSGSTSINATYIWTDGDNIYFSCYDTHYYLPITKKPFPKPTIKPQS